MGDQDFLRGWRQGAADSVAGNFSLLPPSIPQKLTFWQRGYKLGYQDGLDFMADKWPECKQR